MVDQQDVAKVGWLVDLKDNLKVDHWVEHQVVTKAEQMVGCLVHLMVVKQDDQMVDYLAEMMGSKKAVPMVDSKD